MVRLALKNHLADFVASDAHRNPKSFECLKRAYDYSYKKKKIDNKYLNKLFVTNPNKII